MYTICINYNVNIISNNIQLLMSQVVVAILTKADANKDGFIQREEFLAIVSTFAAILTH